MQKGTFGDVLEHNKPIFVQNEDDAQALKASGFQDVRILKNDGVKFADITLYKTPALHGTIKSSSDACGVVFKGEQEKVLYVAGDTIWFDGVRKTLANYQPEVIMLNACAAELRDYGRLIMNDEDVDCVHQTLPEAKLYLTHFDNVAHASITRSQMRGALVRRGVDNYVIPEDGETVIY